MTKRLLRLLGVMIILSMIFCTAVAYASPLSIILEAPSNGAETTAYTQEFIYSFDEYATILNCSLYIDDEFKTMRNSLISIQNNKISAEVEPGTHEWLIKCYDDSFQEIISDTRTFKLLGDQNIEDGYTKISNDDSTITYALTIAPGQDPVELPAAKGGDEIKIVLKGKAYYIDIVRMGSTTTGSFVDVRDRSNAKLYTIQTLSIQAFDFDKDTVIDINLQLDKVERSRDAYFTVTPYPDTPVQEAAPETPTPTPEEPEEELADEEVPVEEPTGSGAATEPETEPQEPDKPAETTSQPEPEDEPEETSMAPLMLVLAIIIVVIVILIVLIAKKKAIATTQKQGAGAKKAETKKADNKKPEDAPPAKADEKPAEIITSTGKKPK